MKILIIAPHADDEVLGVGGSIAKYIDQGHQVFVCIVSRGYPPLIDENTVKTVLKEAEESRKRLGIEEIFFLDFPAVGLEHVQRSEMNEKIHGVIDQIEPERVFLPHFGDLQKDHKIVTEASMVALRPKYRHKVKSIYAYETVSETEWSIPNAKNAFIPNVYVDISPYMDKKIEALTCYQSQLSEFPGARSIENIKALAKFRGATVNVEAAESFAIVRMIE